jgi:predicted phosphodiesterase
VYGNIDSPSIQRMFPEDNIFKCEGITVFMRHIGGYPGRYAPGVKDIIKSSGARIFVSGHSHILKIMYDEKLDCLHINPGAAGRQGWHQVRTAVRFEINGTDIKNCEVIELGSKHAPVV